MLSKIDMAELVLLEEKTLHSWKKKYIFPIIRTLMLKIRKLGHCIKYGIYPRWK